MSVTSFLSCLPQGNLTSLQEVVDLAPNYTVSSRSDVQLFEEGCILSTGVRDCTAACSNASLLWDSTATLHNCLVYTTISEYLFYGGLTDNTTIGIAGDYNILPSGTSDDPAGITSSIDTCVQQTISDWTHGRYNGQSSPLSNLSDHSNITQWTIDLIHDQQSHAYSVESLCYWAPLSINADIGGVGVATSYIMQVGIVLLAWSYNRTLRTWFSGLVFLVFLPLGCRSARQRSVQAQTWLDNTEQPGILADNFDSFQRAQSYFVITIQGAALLALHGSGHLFDGTTANQVLITVFLIGNVATMGIVCLTFGLYILHSSDKRSWHTSTLSGLACIICLVTWIGTRKDTSSLVPPEPPLSTIQACGQYSPARFCDSGYHARRFLAPYNSFEVPIIATCLTALLLLVLDQSKCNPIAILKRAWAFPQKLIPPHMHQLRRQKPTYSDIALKSLRRVSRPLKHGIVETTFVIMVAIVIFLLTMTTHRVFFASEQWTFGQLIAVTIWAPCLIEWVCDAIYGIEKVSLQHQAKSCGNSGDSSDADSDAEGDEGISNHEMTLRPRQQTFYTKLSTRSEQEMSLPLVHTVASSRSSFHD